MGLVFPRSYSYKAMVQELEEHRAGAQAGSVQRKGPGGQLPEQ